MSDENRSSSELERDGRGQFVPGVSGNPSGRPKGIQDKRVQAKEALLSNLLPKAMTKVEAAIDKDEKWAIELVVSYSLPKPRPVDSEEMEDLEQRLRDLEQLATRKLR